MASTFVLYMKFAYCLQSHYSEAEQLDVDLHRFYPDHLKAGVVPHEDLSRRFLRIYRYDGLTVEDLQNRIEKIIEIEGDNNK